MRIISTAEVQWRLKPLHPNSEKQISVKRFFFNGWNFKNNKSVRNLTRRQVWIYAFQIHGCIIPHRWDWLAGVLENIHHVVTVYSRTSQPIVQCKSGRAKSSQATLNFIWVASILQDSHSYRNAIVFKHSFSGLDHCCKCNIKKKSAESWNFLKWTWSKSKNCAAAGKNISLHVLFHWFHHHILHASVFKRRPTHFIARPFEVQMIKSVNSTRRRELQWQLQWIFSVTYDAHGVPSIQCWFVGIQSNYTAFLVRRKWLHYHGNILKRNGGNGQFHHSGKLRDRRGWNPLRYNLR